MSFLRRLIVTAGSDDPLDYADYLPEVGDVILRQVTRIKGEQEDLERYVANAKAQIKSSKDYIKKLKVKLEQDIKGTWSSVEIRNAKGHHK